MENPKTVIVIGVSAGGVEVLTALVRDLPTDLDAAILIVLHISAQAPSLLARILARAGPLPVTQAVDGEPLRSGHIYVPQPDNHVIVEQGFIRVVHGPRENRHRPSIDVLFRTAARAYGSRVIGVVLTGALDDGTAGLLAVKRAGGLTVVQNPDEAMYPSMPRSAIAHVAVDYVVSVADMTDLLVRLVREMPASELPTKPVLIATPTSQMEGEMIQEHDLAGNPSAYSCPECHGVLWEIEDDQLTRYRCRVGHAFSPESMLAQQSDALEDALWSALKTLEESASLSRRLVAQSTERGHPLMAGRFKEKAQTAERHALLIRQVLLTQETNVPDLDAISV